MPVRGKFTAELDVQGVSITSGGISLHDDDLPLRRLGTGSARLIVSALQHDAGPPHVAIIDEIEHGLEPHRIARLLRYLKAPKAGGAAQPQIFATTHSPVVIRELAAADLFLSVRMRGSRRSSRSLRLQEIRIPRRTTCEEIPRLFLARKILVGEGHTEQGLARGLDQWWQASGRDSFGLQTTVAIDGGGKDRAPLIAEHLRDLGYDVWLRLDLDEEPNPENLKSLIGAGEGLRTGRRRKQKQIVN